MTANRKLSATLGALILLGSFSATALAQSQYPTSAGKAAGVGTYGIVRDKPEETPDSETSTPARGKRACMVGKNSVMLVDADSAAADQRDCYDVDETVHGTSGDQDRSGSSFSSHQTGPKSR